MPPDEVRQMILEENGVWRVSLDINASRPSVAKALMEAVGLGRKEAIERAGAKDGEVWRGTKVEAEWVTRTLNSAGIRASVAQDEKHPVA